MRNAGLEDQERYWGTYRPGNYFGLKTRDPHSLVMGLMWFSPSRLRPGGEGIRHWCESGDNLKKYGWNQHDGRTFGVQQIDDEPFQLETSFVKFPAGNYGGHWTARVSVARRKDGVGSRDAHGEDVVEEPFSLIWYTALDEKTGGLMNTNTQTEFTGIRGQTPGLGEFTLNIHKSNGTILNQSYLSTVTPNLQVLRQVAMAHFRLVDDKKTRQRVIALPGDVLTSNTGEIHNPNLIATLITGRPPFAIDIAYRSTNGMTLNEQESDGMGPPILEEYTKALLAKRQEYAQRFENVFHLSAKGYSQADVHFAESAVSNMIGGIGYFYGASRVQSVHTPEPVPYWKAPLYTAVPSRPFFPRGFLWDEGFHGLLIASWDIDIEFDIMAHWFDLINREGWIPREQILGAEALAKVPEEFVTQRNSNANPPTFFLTLKSILAKNAKEKLNAERLSTLERMYPRLQAWFSWYNTTQRGELPGTYRWRGRENYGPEELNPKTLTSGLDDYPRSSHPTDDERHVDLRCWIAMAAGVMADLAHLLERDDSKYLETFYYLSDNALLNEQHLSPYTDTYADWGLHTDAATLKRVPQIAQPGSSNHQILTPHKIRVITKNPELRFVDTTFGYVSLFPFLLELLSPDAPPLAKLLHAMRDPKQLWTQFGLRSLSKASPLYMKRNTENDPPYWRGQIWMNINFLAVRALHHYGSVPGPYSELARQIYVELRQNLVGNVIGQYRRTGFVWEQYNDMTGAGSGCKPFTGWSALTVLMMAEQY